tara:strand:+ start:1581 stop:1775 length:195 start_codon:yes stop_codon:yes gene_type:complete
MTLSSESREEVASMIEEAMDRHVKTSSVISACLGFGLLALFVEGLLRLLGIIPAFMGINISVMS